MPKAPKNQASADSGPSFEDALEQLEELVREMESDQVPLDDLIRKYEEGNRLYKICESRLDQARGRIEILRKKRNGETVLEPFGDDDDAGSEVSSDDDDDEPANDGELF